MNGICPCTSVDSVFRMKIWIFLLAFGCGQPRRGLWRHYRKGHWDQPRPSKAWMNHLSTRIFPCKRACIFRTRGNIWCETGGCKILILNSLLLFNISTWINRNCILSKLWRQSIRLISAVNGKSFIFVILTSVKTAEAFFLKYFLQISHAVTLVLHLALELFESIRYFELPVSAFESSKLPKGSRLWQIWQRLNCCLENELLKISI